MAASSASSTTDDTHSEIIWTVQPEVKSQTLSIATRTVKITLGLLSAAVLVALVVALVMNHQHVSKLKEKIHSLQEEKHELQTMLDKLTENEVAQPPRATTATTTSAAATPTSATTTTSSVMVKPSDVVDRKSSCAAIHTHLPDSASGVYIIYPGGRRPGRSVWCNMDTDGGGWTQFQRRLDGSVAFNQLWEKYQKGFGSPWGEFWLGNDDLHRLTTAQPSELRVDLWDVDGKYGHAKYSTFSVGDPSTNYRLHVAGHSGDIDDSLTRHNSQQFTTTDRDNDASAANCADNNGGGGWWYRACGHSNLNGRYYAGGVRNHQGVCWANSLQRRRKHHNWYSYTGTAMLTRPRQ